MSHHDHGNGHEFGHGYYTYGGHLYGRGYYPTPTYYRQPAAQTSVVVVQPQAMAPETTGLIIGVGVLAAAAILIYAATRK